MNRLLYDMRSYRQALVARINDVYLALHDVYPSSQADWLGERLAGSYVAYTRNRELSARQRTAVFNVLLNISLGESSEMLSNGPAILPEGVLADLRAILREEGM